MSIISTNPRQPVTAPFIHFKSLYRRRCVFQTRQRLVVEPAAEEPSPNLNTRSSPRCALRAYALLGLRDAKRNTASAFTSKDEDALICAHLPAFPSLLQLHPRPETTRSARSAPPFLPRGRSGPGRVSARGWCGWKPAPACAWRSTGPTGPRSRATRSEVDGAVNRCSGREARDRLIQEIGKDQLAKPKHQVHAQETGSA